MDVRSGSEGATAVILIDNGTPNSTPIDVSGSSIVNLAGKRWQVSQIALAEQSDRSAGIGAGPGSLSLRLLAD